MTVTPAALSVTVDPSSKVFGSANPDFTVSYLGFQNGDTPASLAGTLAFATVADATSAVGTYPVSASGLSSANYTITFVDGTLTVTPAALTVTVDPSTKVFGSANPDFTVTYLGFENGDTPASLAGTLTFATVADATSAVGTYPVSASGRSSANYTITYVDGTLTVTPAALTVTADRPAKVYGSANPALTVSYLGFVNGDTAASLTGTMAFATAADATSAVGTYPMSASGLSSANYTITYVDGTLTVTPAALTVTADPSTKVFGAANPDFTVTYLGFVNGDTPASLTGTMACATAADATSAVGTYPMSATGLSSANYTITYVDGTLTVTPAALTVTADRPDEGVRVGEPGLDGELPRVRER